MMEGAFLFLLLLHYNPHFTKTKAILRAEGEETLKNPIIEGIFCLCVCATLSRRSHKENEGFLFSLFSLHKEERSRIDSSSFWLRLYVFLLPSSSSSLSLFYFKPIRASSSSWDSYWKGTRIPSPDDDERHLKVGGRTQ